MSTKGFLAWWAVGTAGIAMVLATSTDWRQVAGLAVFGFAAVVLMLDEMLQHPNGVREPLIGEMMDEERWLLMVECESTTELERIAEIIGKAMGVRYVPVSSVAEDSEQKYGPEEKAVLRNADSFAASNLIVKVKS